VATDANSNLRRIDVVKNRFDGTLGKVYVQFEKQLGMVTPLKNKPSSESNNSPEPNSIPEPVSSSSSPSKDSPPLRQHTMQDNAERFGDVQPINRDPRDNQHDHDLPPVVSPTKNLDDKKENLNTKNPEKSNLPYRGSEIVIE
jgi:hypothetical protein